MATVVGVEEGVGSLAVVEGTLGVVAETLEDLDAGHLVEFQTLVEETEAGEEEDSHLFTLPCRRLPSAILVPSEKCNRHLIITCIQVLA